MAHHLLHRLIGAAIVLLAVTAVTFVVLTAAPGDVVAGLIGDTASAEQVAQLRADLGLDRPVWLRYADFVQGMLTRGDLGQSLITDRPVATLVGERLPYTALLAFTATALAGVLGLLVGLTAARRAGSLLDTALMTLINLGMALPSFWLALLLILLFSLHLRWLPVVGAGTPQHLILPAITLALPTAAVVARLVRSALLDVIQADFVRTARAKGLASPTILRRHILRNALIPVITVLGLHLGYLLGGAFIVETIYGWPGLGRLTVQAIFDRDLPVVLGATLTIASLYICINFVVDLLHAWLDPRVAQDVI